MVKREIAHHEQFLLLQECFPKSFAANVSKWVYMWETDNAKLFENIVTKEEIAQNEQFLLLSQCFPLLVIGYPFNYRDFLFLAHLSFVQGELL